MHRLAGAYITRGLSSGAIIAKSFALEDTHSRRLALGDPLPLGIVRDHHPRH